jgi:L-rhamnose mutarotase
MRVTPHTRVRADRVAEAQREVPEQLTDAVRAAGATSWTIRRSRTDLVHVLERQDCARLLAEPEGLPVDVARPARKADLPDVVHDHSGDGANAGLPVVRELP